MAAVVVSTMEVALAGGGVFLFGASVGLGELLARYRDEPVRAVRTPPAYLYVALNALAALGAFALMRVFGWGFGMDSTQEHHVLWVQILVAGFGAMAFFRSSFFTVRVGEADVAVGPSSFLQVVLDASDRGVDRLRAEARAREVLRVMKGVSYARASAALPTFCLTLMQNLPIAEQTALAEEIGKLDGNEIDEDLKTFILGLKLMNVVGEGVLLEAVTVLGPRIQRPHSIALPAGLTLAPAAEHRVQVDVLGEAVPDALLAWSSSNEEVVRVNADGCLVAVAPGSATVTASFDGIAAHMEVRVGDAPAGAAGSAPAADRLRGIEIKTSGTPST
jgi:hypothetical protein